MTPSEKQDGILAYGASLQTMGVSTYTYITQLILNFENGKILLSLLGICVTLCPTR
jgi:hypothetical protein